MAITFNAVRLIHRAYVGGKLSVSKIGNSADPSRPHFDVEILDRQNDGLHRLCVAFCLSVLNGYPAAAKNLMVALWKKRVESIDQFQEMVELCQAEIKGLRRFTIDKQGNGTAFVWYCDRNNFSGHPNTEISITLYNEPSQNSSRILIHSGLLVSLEARLFAAQGGTPEPAWKKYQAGNDTPR